MTLTFTILGCGSSGGVPRPGTGWGACDPNNRKNRRRRCALLVERHGTGGVTRVLIDTGPDLRDQLIELRDQFEVLFLALSETYTRIDDDRLTRDATPFRHVNTRTQTSANLFHDVRDRRHAMHRRGCASRMHQHQPCSGTRHRIRNVEIKPQRGNVVDDRRARIQRRTRDF